MALEWKCTSAMWLLWIYRSMCPFSFIYFFPMWFVFLQSTSNYHARRFGVRAAMPGFIARRLCPQLIIVPPNFDKYHAVSREVSLMFHIYLEPFTHFLSLRAESKCTTKLGLSFFFSLTILSLFIIIDIVYWAAYGIQKITSMFRFFFFSHFFHLLFSPENFIALIKT